jgi:hypothetical protein
MRTAERLLKSFRAENDVDDFSPQVQRLYAEWEQDQTMARERHETGIEPKNRPIEPRVAPVRNTKRTPRSKGRSDGIDIPF